MYVMIMMVRSGMGPTLLLPAATGPVKRTDADQPADQLAGQAGQTGQRQPPHGQTPHGMGLAVPRHPDKPAGANGAPAAAQPAPTRPYRPPFPLDIMTGSVYTRLHNNIRIT
ncbi:MAG TPA: hypothetical protein DEV75_02715 [Desulfovibrio sp.]|jgi:hypothetical protein|nr:hypothetical protein [Desulfovibrio sp.]